MSGVVLNMCINSGRFGYPWINWIKGGFGYAGNASNINSNGCPVAAPPHSEIASNQWRMTIPTPGSTNYSGHWVLKWPGQGAFSIDTQDAAITEVGTSGFVVSNSGTKMLVAGTNVRVEFTTATTAGSWFGQMNDTQTYSGMGAPVLVRLADETAQGNGEIFNPDFITTLKAINPAVIRFMQWEPIAGFDCVSSKPYTYDTPLNYISYASFFQLGPYVGTITNTSDSFTCSAASDTPATITDGEMVWGTVSAANTTTSPRLNIGGRGYKPIKNHYGGTLNIGDIPAGADGSFMYNAQTDSYWTNTDEGDFGMAGTPIPLPAAVALANEVGCDAWFCIPWLALDSEAYAMAAYVAANLINRALWEVANELWGGVPHPADQAQTLATSHGTGVAQMLGYFMRRFFGQVTAAWDAAGRSRATLRRVAAWQMASGALSDWSTDALQGQNFTLMTSLGWDTAPNRPIDFIDVLAYAPYYEGPNTPAYQTAYGSQASQQALYTAADDYASGDAQRMRQALDFVDADIRYGYSTGNGDPTVCMNYVSSVYAQNWENLAATFDGSRTTPLMVYCYEGAPQINAPATGTLTGLGINTAYSAKIANLFAAYKNDARYKQLVLDQMQAFMKFRHSVAPSWYNFTGDELQWSLSAGDLYATPFKSYDALVAFKPLPKGGGSNLRGGF